MLARKLRAFKTDLKKWNEEGFGNIGKQRNHLFDGIHDPNIIVGKTKTERRRRRKRERKLKGLGEVYSPQRNELEAEVKDSLVEKGRQEHQSFLPGGKFE